MWWAIGVDLWPELVLPVTEIPAEENLSQAGLTYLW